MLKLKLISVVLVASFLTAACNDDNDSFVAPTPVAGDGIVRVLHASSDAPPVNVSVNGTEILSAVPFETGSGNFTLPEGIYSVQVDAIIPGGTATVIGPLDVNVNTNFSTDVIAVGDVANIEAIAVTRASTAPPADSVRVQVIHAASAAPPVDVYVTAPGADLAQSAPLGSFAFKEALTPVVVPAGSYQIRITPAGSGTVVFDSGSVPLPADASLVVSAINNVDPGPSPVKLVVQDGTQSFTIQDINATAAVRVIHNAPDALPVDIIVNDNFAQPLVEDLPFPQFTDYVEVPPDSYNVKVTEANNPGTIYINEDLALVPGEYSVYAMDFVSAGVKPLVLIDDNRDVATEARVRIVHGSPSAGPVDIYVTAPGAGIDTTDPAFSAVPFLADTGYVSLAPGSYDVTVTPAGTKTAAIGPVTLDLLGGGIYTAVARDAANGGLPLGLILLDDFN